MTDTQMIVLTRAFFDMLQKAHPSAKFCGYTINPPLRGKWTVKIQGMKNGAIVHVDAFPDVPVDADYDTVVNTMALAVVNGRVYQKDTL